MLTALNLLSSAGVRGRGCFLRMLCALPPGPSPLHPQSDPEHLRPVLGPKPAVFCQRDHTLDIIDQRVPGPSHLCVPVSSLPQEADSRSEPPSSWTGISDRVLHPDGDAQQRPLKHKPGSVTSFSSSGGCWEVHEDTLNFLSHYFCAAKVSVWSRCEYFHIFSGFLQCLWEQK